MGLPRSTVRVSNIPRTAIAEELLRFFESAVGPVFAIEIFSAHRNWMSLGFGRVQFDSLAAAETAALLSYNGRLSAFQCSHLSVSPMAEDIIPRAADASNRIGGAVFHAVVPGDEGRMEVFASWEGAGLEFMPERKKLEVFVEDKGQSYKLVVMFDDVVTSHGCCVGGGGARLNSVLLQKKSLENFLLVVELNLSFCSSSLHQESIKEYQVQI